MKNIDIISIEEKLASLTFLPNRTPESTSDDLSGCFAELATYRDGFIFIGHYAGNSQWERHPSGDEIVMVLDGETTLFVLKDGIETPYVLSTGQFLVVKQNLWHRFETPTEVKILTVTPQPEEHSLDFPEDS